MEEISIAARLKSIIEALGLSDSQFADRCSITRPTLSLLLSGKNKKISDIMLSQIHDAFPNVSILWLLFGEGEMFKKDDNNEKSSSNFNEDPFFKNRDTDDKEELNLVNVKHLENIIQDVINKTFTSSFNNLERIIQKSQEISLQRKVSKITVYYDDSTFETFSPE